MNPSNQPEPNYAPYICKGVHCKCMDMAGTCKRFHNGDHTCPMSQPDAQAELGLQGNWLDSALLSFASLYAEGDLDAAEAGRKAILAAVEADKAAAVVEAEQSLLNQLNDELFFSTTQPDGQFIKDVIMAKLEAIDKKRYQPLARLQPPTVGEGGSV